MRETKSPIRATAVLADGSQVPCRFCGLDELGNYLLTIGRSNALLIRGTECRDVRIQISDTITVSQDRLCGAVTYDRRVKRTGSVYRNASGSGYSIECRVKEDGGTAYAHYPIAISSPHGWDHNEWINEPHHTTGGIA